MNDADRTPTQEEKMQHLAEMLKDMSSVMMTTSPNGTLASARSRPMSIARRDADGTLYFLTSADTTQVEHVRRDDVGMCTGQAKTAFLTLQGTFNIEHERSLVDALWSKMSDAYFPKGKDDPDIRVIVFRPKTAELWDVSGAKGIAYLIDVAKSWITKEPPKASAEQHATIDISPTSH